VKKRAIFIPLVLHLVCQLRKLILFFILVLLFIGITYVGEHEVLPHLESLAAILGSLEVGSSSLELVEELFPMDVSGSPNCCELVIGRYCP
jgi:hypothetical protein